MSMNILVDFYNLKLTGNPDSDKDKVINFLSKYAPQVTRYLTEKDIELKLKEGSVDAGEIGGTLGMYEHINKESWFKLNYGYYYQRIYKAIVVPVVETYLQNQEIIKPLFVMVGSLTTNIRISSYCQNEQGQKFSATWVPESIDPSKYTFGEHKSFTTELTKGELALGGMEYALFQEIHSLWNRKKEIRKCEAPDCSNIYEPSNRGRTQEFCSNRCLKRIRMREIRQQKNVAVFS